MADRFAAPHNWCDRRCERCVLTATCPLFRRTEGLRWRSAMRGEDPDDPEVAMRVVGDELARAQGMLEAIVAEGADDLASASEVEPPASLFAERMRRAGLDYVVATRRCAMAARSPRTEATPAVAARLTSTSVLVPMKLAHLTAYLDEAGRPNGGDGWAACGVPNLMVVQRVLDACDRGVAALRGRVPSQAAEDVRRARGALDRVLSPLVAVVDAEAWSEIDRWIGEGRAPSPFLVASG